MSLVIMSLVGIQNNKWQEIFTNLELKNLAILIFNILTVNNS